MKISSAFPSNYLKAADLNGGNVRVTMNHVAMEDIGGDHKPVLYFQGKERGLVLNKTNANNISIAYGDETDQWSGRELILYPTWVDFQGRSTEAIRVRAPQPKDGQVAPPPTPPVTHEVALSNQIEDDVPF